MDGNLAARERLDPSLNVLYPDPVLKHHDSAGNVGRIIRFLRQQNPDVLVTSNWGSMDWALARNLTRTRHIHMEDGFGPEERNAQLPRRVLTRRVALRGSQVIVPSKTLLKIATDIWRLPAHHLHYIPNGIDVGRFHNVHKTILPPGKGKIIGTIAALRPEKNLARLLRAFAIVQQHIQARLVVVGDGPEHAGLKDLARHLGITDSCHFAGHTTMPESWLAAFDIFALSSDTEQMPLSIMEAMAAGLPIASTDVGDVRTMLAPENCRYVVPCDDSALANAIESLVADPGIGSIGDVNRAKAETDFSATHMFKSYRNLITAA
jgi:glycosyltransferase involved in cell wall biosynthesis